MRKRAAAIVIFILCLMMALPVFAVSTEAAPRLNKKKVSLYVGKTVKLKVKGTTEKVKWSSSANLNPMGYTLRTLGFPNISLPK